MVDLYFNCNDVLRSMRPELYDIGLAHHGAIMRLSTKVRPVLVLHPISPSENP
jgi:hypothetical protein